MTSRLKLYSSSIQRWDESSWFGSVEFMSPLATEERRWMQRLTERIEFHTRRPGSRNFRLKESHRKVLVDLQNADRSKSRIDSTLAIAIASRLHIGWLKTETLKRHLLRVYCSSWTFHGLVVVSGKRRERQSFQRKKNQRWIASQPYARELTMHPYS